MTSVGFSNGTMFADNVDFTGSSESSIQPRVTTNGQLLIGSSVAPNIRVGTLASSDSSITITTGNGTIDLKAGSTTPDTFVTDSGSAVPTAGILNDLGSGSITTTGSGNTVTTQLTGLTNHSVLVGAGTTTITKVGPTATSGQVLQSSGASADPSFSTATYPSTTIINQILYSTSNNVVGGLATANRGVLTTGATGIPVVTALATDGQVIIGSTAGSPAAATLTAGSGVSIANGSNTITISSSGGGVTWTEVTGTSQAAVVQNGYIANNAGLVTVTLPAAFAVGDVVRVGGKGAGLFALSANTGDVIHFGITDTSSGGALTALARYNTVEVVGITANSDWLVLSSVGSFTVT